MAEAAKARALGAGHVSGIFAACSRTLILAPRLFATIERWPRDLAASAIAFRLSAGLHALVRSGRAPMLQSLGATAAHERADADTLYDLAVADALTVYEDEILKWLSHPTQTNETARIAGLMGVLCELDSIRPLKTELLELGSSAGLNLNLAQYSFILGQTRVGPETSSVRIAPEWRGRAVPQVSPAIVRSSGTDLDPLDVSRADHRELLLAYTWPCMTQRIARLNGAMAIAKRQVPQVERCSAGPWLAAQVSRPQAEGVRRVVFHSMVMQYVPLEERAEITRTLAAAGALASPGRPLLRVGFEWREDRRDVELRLTQWDGSCQQGKETLIATCHPYAEWFDWYGLDQS